MCERAHPAPATLDDLHIAEWEETAARRLLEAQTHDARCRLYAEIYDDDNAVWLSRHGRLGMSGVCAKNHALIRRACGHDGIVLDVGGGAGVARDALSPARRFIVCDASRIATSVPDGASGPVRRVLGYATMLPFASHSVAAALVLDVLEHLHVDDIERCLAECRRVLRPGGRLLIATPHRLSGPWDARGNLQDARRRLGLHLNELTVSGMLHALGRHGFRPRGFLTQDYRGWMWRMPPLLLWAVLWETATVLLPHRFRSRLCRLAVVLADAP
jgi:SAM-dependent methyltransferase